MVDGFLLGVIVTASLAIAGYFFRFWRHTRDLLFLGFAAAFAIIGLNRLALLFAEHPNEGGAWTYSVRLLAYLLILAAIIHKNRT